MSRAKTLAQLLGSDGALNVADVSGAVNKAGDTMAGDLVLSGTSRKQSIVDGPTTLALGLWDGTNNRIESVGRPLRVVQYGSNAVVFENANSGGRFQMDSAGRVTMPYQPSFLASGSRSVNAATWGKISDGFTTLQHNIGSCYNTANGTFTAPVGGRYTFYCGGYTSAFGNGERYAFNVRVNGGSQTYIGGGNFSLVDTPISGMSVTLALSAGDYVDLLSFSALAVTYGVGAHTFYFGGHLIG